MKRAKRILFLLGGVFSIIDAITFFITGLVFVILGPTIGSLIAQSDEQGASIFLGVYLAVGLVFIFVAFLDVINAILSFKARYSKSNALMIANIIFGVLTDVIVNLVGAIFGLILISREEKEDNAIEG